MFEEKKSSGLGQQPQTQKKLVKAPASLKGASVQPGNPNGGESQPVGIVKRRFETDKHADKRLNKMFKDTNAANLGVWNHDKKNDLMAKPDRAKFNPALDKTKEIKQAKANMPLGKPNKDFDPVREKMIGQGFSPATKPAEKYKWSEGLSDDDNARVNKSLNSLAAYAGDKDLSRVNKDWGNDLYYQLKNEGASEEDALRLSEHFGKTAPSYEEANPDYKPAKRKFNVTLDGNHLGQVEAVDEYEAERLAQQQWPGHPDDDLLSVEEAPSKKKALWDRYNSLDDDQKRDFALNVYKYGTDAHDNPLGKFRDPYTGEIMYADAENNYEDKSDYLLGKDEDSRAQLEEAVNNLDIDNMSDEEVEKLFGEHEIEDLEPWDEDEEDEPAPQQPQINTDYTRKVLKSMGYKDDDIDMILNSIPETHMKF